MSISFLTFKIVIPIFFQHYKNAGFKVSLYLGPDFTGIKSTLNPASAKNKFYDLYGENKSTCVTSIKFCYD